MLIIEQWFAHFPTWRNFGRLTKNLGFGQPIEIRIFFLENIYHFGEILDKVVWTPSPKNTKTPKSGRKTQNMNLMHKGKVLDLHQIQLFV